MAIRPRWLTGIAADALGDARVLIVNGARQAGKTTLLRMLHERLGGVSVTLDDPAVLAAARSDPLAFVESGRRPMFIDEVQRGGDPLILSVPVASRRPSRARLHALAHDGFRRMSPR